jgi:hypothetical protein
LIEAVGVAPNRARHQLFVRRRHGEAEALFLSN